MASQIFLEDPNTAMGKLDIPFSGANEGITCLPSRMEADRIWSSGGVDPDPVCTVVHQSYRPIRFHNDYHLLGGDPQESRREAAPGLFLRHIIHEAEQLLGLKVGTQEVD